MNGTPLGPLDTALASALTQQWPDAPDGAWLLVARLSAAIAEGHSCIMLDEEAGQVMRAWRAVGDGEADRPLVLDDALRLYLRRYWLYEARVAAQLHARASLAVATEATIAAALDRHFPPEASDPAQRAAAALALRGGLAVILGGPGTGKTWTLVRTLAALVDAHADATPPLRIALAATTGKAAQRLNEVLAAELAGNPQFAALRDAPPRAGTVHALIGMRRDSVRPRYDATAPLPYDVVVVDEASMLDLPMMAHLLAALPVHARLVLVGDPDQLASVEAGSVLAELRREHDESPDSAIGVCVTTLQHARRFDDANALARALDAIRAGDAPALFDALADRDVFEWHEGLPASPSRAVADHPLMRALAADGDIAQRLNAFAQTRALAALREGPFGVAALNAALRRARGGRRDGEPVLISANAPALGLANGDIGVYEDGDDPGVWFAGSDGTLRRLREADLPAHAPAWAMTVHKAQGSEFAHVLVLLPQPAHPLVSREWLYTALSRARRTVALWATRAALAAALDSPARRLSGLRDRLAAGDQEKGAKKKGPE